ncbi:MAG: helix-turn-helix domain-containing protein [Clostridiales Family XIII bacterium]|jgi:sugar diacid utilization regulator|nr:helix-turn-helix domain-containing protein [Clostridiales Family XIII bacterium]
MQISLNILLDALKNHNFESYTASDANPSFTKCLPIPDAVSEFNANCIYVGSLTKALSMLRDRENVYCICLRDRIRDDSETAERLSCFVVVNEPITHADLLTLVQGRFFEISEWVYGMQRALIQGCSIQDLTDLCEQVIDNHIGISDSALMLMAYSRNIPCDDPISQALVEYGYHTDETIKRFKKYDVFKVWERATGIYVDADCTAAKYVTLHKIFKFGNVYFAHVVMSCNRNPLTPGMIDLFKIFTDALAVLVERTWEAKSAKSHLYDTFLKDLIEGSITNREIIKERSEYVGIPASGLFRIFLIIPGDTSIPNGKILTEFSNEFPEFKFMSYRQNIVALNHFYTADTDEQMKGVRERLEAFLLRNEAHCGVSLPFRTLETSSVAYKQASMALKYTRRLPGRALLSPNAPEKRTVFFAEEYIYCILGEHVKDGTLWSHGEYYEKLKKLHAYDRRHNSNNLSNLQILYAYFKNDRNASKTGAALNMHKNNIIYHINRIEEMLNLRFKDPEVCFMTQLAFHLLEIFGFDDEGE